MRTIKPTRHRSARAWVICWVTTGLQLADDRIHLATAGSVGSYGFADPDYGLSFALTKNRLVATTPPEVPASVVLANTVREALSVPNG